MTTTAQRQYLAALFDGGEEPPLLPNDVPESLVLAATAFCESRVAELGANWAAAAADEVSEASNGEVDATLAIRAALIRAIDQAKRDTAEAIRSGALEGT